MSVSAECNFVKLLKAPAAPDSVRDAASSDGPSVVQRLRNEVGWLSAGLAWLSAVFGWPLHPEPIATQALRAPHRTAASGAPFWPTQKKEPPMGFDQFQECEITPGS